MSTTLFPTSCGGLILAAGKGTRMHSKKPKVLHTILGDPLLAHVRAALEPLFGERVWAVIGHEADMVRAAFAARPLRCIEQREQLGTGHALMVALPELLEAGLESVLVVNGDTPLVTTGILEAFVQDACKADIAVATLTLPDAGAYGRIVREQGRFSAIVEAKDYDNARYGAPTGEINAGVYFLRLQAVAPLVAALQNTNASGEYYITDLVASGVAQGLRVQAFSCGDAPELLGINNPVELARSEELRRQAIVQDALERGVVIHGADTVRIGAFVRLEPGAELGAFSEIYGTSTVASGAFIDSHCRILDSHIGAEAVIHAFSHLEQADVGTGCLVGPYARLRPGAVMESKAHVGNFVEMKKARLGEGAKANHLTYLGDTTVGARANIGAGTITCNYDGVHKHQTVIGEEAFIGSNSSLVAPVRVGNRALVGAGSVITKDVPDDMLAVARGKQSALPRKKN